MSDLQLALIALGAVFVAAVFGYNVLQERKSRKRAEATFRAPGADPLLDPAADRREPTLGAVPGETRGDPSVGSIDELTAPLREVAPQADPQAEPAGGAILSTRIDSVALVLAHTPVTGEQLESLLDALADHAAAVAREGLVEERWLPVSETPQTDARLVEARGIDAVNGLGL